jgi:hypothetical protein
MHAAEMLRSLLGIVVGRLALPDNFVNESNLAKD